jgi:hypothetical protein
MVLVTSLTDQGAYPLHAFEHLYSQRWGIEESFKTLKHHLDIEGFTGELPQSIEQEIQAKALLYNITQALCALAQERVDEKNSLAGQSRLCPAARRSAAAPLVLRLLEHPGCHDSGFHRAAHARCRAGAPRPLFSQKTCHRRRPAATESLSGAVT